MLLERIYDEDLAQASYLIGCQATGEAVVVDPRRDIGVYLDIAHNNGMRISAVTETHIHADYLSGTRELAAATGATIYVSGEGGPDWLYGAGFDGATLLSHGDRIGLGNITLEARHTPGHTPEHLSFLITDGAQSPEPGFMLTGDFVFVGDVGRPDLLDETADQQSDDRESTREESARALFASLRDQFATLPDFVQVLPGHGSGSACGKALGAVPTSTVGYERRFSWWGPHVEADDEAGFVSELLSGQPDAHAYFARMKRENREGPAILGELPELVEYDEAHLRARLDDDEAIFIDTRHHSEVHQGTVPRSLHVPGIAQAASYGAWVLDPETEPRPLVLLAPHRAAAHAFRDHLLRVGIDSIQGFITTLDGLPLEPVPRVSPADLASVPHAMLLDVRNRTEYAAGHLPGAHNISGGRALWHVDELPRSGTIVSYCRSGVRNAVAASALRRAGLDVIELEGSYQAWAAIDGNAPTVPAAVDSSLTLSERAIS